MHKNKRYYNKKCSNIVFLFYSGNDGGKFLGNCLALNDQGFLQDQELVIQQLFGYLTPKQKLELFIDRLEKTVKWNDLGLGDARLFGTDELNPANFNPIIKYLSNQEKYFFKVIHFPDIFAKQCALWPNAKKIAFVRTGYFGAYRNNLKYKASYEERNLLIAGPDALKWDPIWYSNENDFITNLYKLYQALNIKEFDKSLILSYYKAYIQTIDRLKNTTQ